MEGAASRSKSMKERGADGAVWGGGGEEGRGEAVWGRRVVRTASSRQSMRGQGQERAVRK